MSSHLSKFHIFILSLASLFAACQNNQPTQSTAHNSQNPEAKFNTAVAEMVRQVSADSIEANVRKLVSFGTRHSLSDTISDIRGIGAARRWVKSRFDHYAKASKGRMTVQLDPFLVESGRRITEPVTMKNTMATLHGTDPEDDRVFVISGHLDSRVTDVMDFKADAPGANDDASGVALVVELARIMTQYEFPSTIIFVAVQGEEQGLLGATHLANRLKKDSVHVVAMFNNDMVGNTASSETMLNNDSTVRIFSETIPLFETEEMKNLREYTGADNDSPSRQLARYIKEVGEKYTTNFSVTLNFRRDRYLRGGDHLPFSRNGFTAVRFCEMNENYLHQHQDVKITDGIQYGDLPQFVNFKYAAQIARVNLASLSSLAMAPYAPRDVMLNVELANTSTLSWSAPPRGPRPVGYNVLIRETYEPHWSKKIFVSDTSITIPYSKDNFFFAVESVGRQNVSSLAVFPRPRR